MWANIIATGVHIGLALFLAVNLNWGIYGVAVASSIQFIVRFLVTYGYIRFSSKFKDDAH